MDTRVAVISIIVENIEAVEKINELLHQYRDCIIGRMGVPHPSKRLSIISVAIDGPMNTISALSGKLGALQGVTTKTVYSKARED
ncbi:MAG: iron-only hydrogenase system regulator [Firmicutes bacterium]|nr:iron-only hydrogenase system regulator [Bacillota bacterium]